VAVSEPHTRTHGREQGMTGDTVLRSSSQVHMGGHGSSSDTGQVQTQNVPRARNKTAESSPKLPKMLKGSVHAQRAGCGGPGCRCGRGELHNPYFHLSIRARERATTRGVNATPGLASGSPDSLGLCKCRLRYHMCRNPEYLLKQRGKLCPAFSRAGGH